MSSTASSPPSLVPSDSYAMTASPAPSEEMPSSALPGIMTAAQRALAIPEILERVLRSAAEMGTPADVRSLRLVAKGWEETTDMLLLHTGITLHLNGHLMDLKHRVPLGRLVASRGGMKCLQWLYFGPQRAVQVESSVNQLLLCSGLVNFLVTTEAIPAIAAALRQRANTENLLAFPMLKSFHVLVASTASSLLAEDIATICAALGEAVVGLRLLLKPCTATESVLAALQALAAGFACRNSSLCIGESKLGDTPLTTIRSTCRAIPKLLQVLPRLIYLEITADVAFGMLKLVHMPSPPQLLYIAVTSHHYAATALLREMALLAEKKDSIFRPFVFRCEPHPHRDRETEKAWARRTRAAEDAIAAWKKHRGMEVPSLVAESWLACVPSFKTSASLPTPTLPISPLYGSLSELLHAGSMSLDPRLRLHAAADDLLHSLAASFSGHADWLAGQLAELQREQQRLQLLHNSNKQPAATAVQPQERDQWQALLKSPERKRRLANVPANAAAKPGFGTASTTTGKAANIFGAASNKPAIASNKPSTSTQSLARSPAKRGLALTIPDRTHEEDKENKSSSSAPSPNGFLAKSTRSNALKASTASTSSNNARAGPVSPRAPPPGPSRNASLRSPARSALQSSTSSTQARRQPASPAVTAPQSPITRAAAVSSKIASPQTARPATRIAAQKVSPASSQPKKVVDDVFMLEGETSPEDQQQQESSQEDGDDDEEVADILLGYASMNGKTPAKAQPTPSAPVPHSLHSQKLIARVREADNARALPEVPAAQPSPAAETESAKSQPQNGSPAPAPAVVKLSNLHTSPPRPEKSPLRPSPSPPKAQLAPSAAPVAAAAAASVSPSKPVSVLAQIQSKLQAQSAGAASQSQPSSPAKKQTQPAQVQVQPSPRPAPRNMSNLASIASVLGSPTKPATAPPAVAQQIGSPLTRSTRMGQIQHVPMQAIQAAKALPPPTAVAGPQSRPGSPSLGSPSRVPVPRFGATASQRPGSPAPAAKAASAPSQLKGPSTNAAAGPSGAPRVRSPLMADKISYFQSQSQKDLASTASIPGKLASPPLRQSSRIAALQSPSPPASPKTGFGFSLRATGSTAAAAAPSSSRPGSPVPAQGASKIGSLAKSPRMQKVNDVAAVASPKRPLISPIQSPKPTDAPKEMRTKDFASPAPAPASASAKSSAPPAKGLLEATSPLQEEPPSSSKPLSAATTELQPPLKPKSASASSKPLSASSAHHPIPPSPIFSSFLSHGPSNRTSAFSFVGLPGRSTAGIGHTREKSLGLGLGLGLGKSLSAANAARLLEKEGQQDAVDSQGSTTSAGSFASALSSQQNGKKRLSAALLEHGSMQPVPDTFAAKIAKVDSASSASSSAAARASIVPSSKEDETKAKLEALRNRISSFRGANALPSTGRMSTAAVQYAGRQSTAPSLPLASSSRMSTAVVLTADSAASAHPTLFSPPVVQAAKPAPVPIPMASASTAAAPAEAEAATSSAVQSESVAQAAERPPPRVPSSPGKAAPAGYGFTSAISTSFANLFGMSTLGSSKAAPSPSAEKPAPAQIHQVPLYPSLPSTTGLSAPSSSKQTPNLMDEEEAVEELISSPPPVATKANAGQEEQGARSRRSSSASVQEIVEAFEAKTAIAAREASRSPEQQRKRASGASNILYPKLPSSTGLFSKPAPTPAIASAQQPLRSTTPEFSPSKASQEQVQRLSLTLASKLATMPAAAPAPTGESGELDIADPDVEPIARARASSVGTEAVATPEEEDEEVDREMQTSPVKAEPASKWSSPARGQPEEVDMIDSDAEMDHVPPVLAKAGKVPAPATKPTASSGPQIEIAPKAPSKPFVPSKSTSTSTGASSFKPSKPTVEVSSVADVSKISRPATATGFHRPLSRAPSMTSLAPSRASTISVASSAGVAAALTKSTNGSMNKKTAGLNGSVSGKPEVKSLQLAAQAAKKEQAEKERKIAQKEERDNKRAALQAAKGGDGTGADGEKKRKERGDEASQLQQQPSSSQGGGGSSQLTTAKGKAPMIKPKNAPGSNRDKDADEPAKKRKMMEVEVVVAKSSSATGATGGAVKKTTVVRSASQAASSQKPLASSTSSRAVAGSSHSAALAASANMIGVTKQASSSSSSSKHAARASQASRAPLTTSAGPGAKMPLGPSKASQPSALLSQHAQAMSALSKSVLTKSSAGQQQQRAPEPKHPQQEFEPEPFALPDIDSEYSDSDDEAHAKKEAAMPVWTHSPELRQALAVQATFNPDELFGEIPQLRMEEMFTHKSTAARLRFRTSSANWTGVDALHRHEELEYARRMGFTKQQ